MSQPTPGNETHVTMLPNKATGEGSFPGYVKCVTLPASEHLDERTVLIMQRFLFTKIETQVTREEAQALCTALIAHFAFDVSDIDKDEL